MQGAPGDPLPVSAMMSPLPSAWGGAQAQPPLPSAQASALRERAEEAETRVGALEQEVAALRRGLQEVRACVRACAHGRA